MNVLVLNPFREVIRAVARNTYQINLGLQQLDQMQSIVNGIVAYVGKINGHEYAFYFCCFHDDGCIKVYYDVLLR